VLLKIIIVILENEALWDSEAHWKNWRFKKSKLSAKLETISNAFSLRVDCSFRV